MDPWALWPRIERMRIFREGFGPMNGLGRRFGMAPERLFGRGDMKFLLLELLLERPKHGYEMIKELESRFAGWYAPSPGTIYPTLQMMEDRGYVRSVQDEGKRVYAITDDGRSYLQEHRPPAPAGGRRFGKDFGASPEMRAFAREAFDFGRAMMQAARSSGDDPARMARLRAVLDHARREIYAIQGEVPPTPPTTEV